MVLDNTLSTILNRQCLIERYLKTLPIYKPIITIIRKTQHSGIITLTYQFHSLNVA